MAIVRAAVLVLGVIVGTVVLATTVAAGPHVGSEAGRGSVGIRLVPAPGPPSNDPLSEDYVVARVTPGSRIVREVQIDNDTQATMDVMVYPAAASIVKGSFAFGPGHSENQLSSWTAVSQKVLRLAPGAEAFDAVSIEVPGTASPGPRYAVVWAQVSAPPRAGGSVTVVNRVGVRVYLSAGPGAAAAPNFSIGALTAARSPSGRPMVAGTAHNTGATTLHIDGSLSLSAGPGGVTAGPFPAQVGAVLAPGASEPVSVPLPTDLPRGPWRAALALGSGELHRTASATLEFPAPFMRVSRSPHDGVLVLLVALFALLFVLAMGALVVYRRRSLLIRPG